MTKREKLRGELAEKERWLAEAINARECNCICHTDPGILHFISCCSISSKSIPELRAEVLALKKKLRIV